MLALEAKYERKMQPSVNAKGFEEYHTLHYILLLIDRLVDRSNLFSCGCHPSYPYLLRQHLQM